MQLQNMLNVFQKFNSKSLLINHLLWFRKFIFKLKIFFLITDELFLKKKIRILGLYFRQKKQVNSYFFKLKKFVPRRREI